MADPVTARSSPVALVGAGSMGIGWAIVFARAGHPVALHDADPAALDRVPAALAARLDGLAAFGLLDEAPAAVAARVRLATGLADALDGAVHVQESVLERRDVKAPLFAEMDRLARPDAVLASSSSAIPVSEIAGDLPGRARCLVAHPANPPFLLPVVELVPAPFTDPDAVARTRALMAGAGQSPVVLGREIEGFVFNRLQGAVLREAYCLVRDGVASVADIDRVMTDGLGLRWSVIGPFETSDLNYRGGLREHARRMGAAYARMGASRGQDDPWTDDLVAAADDQRRALVPLDRWEARVAWRDRALMALALLTGARGAALATLKLKHIDLEQGCIHQDARDVKTKASKTFTTWFCPVGGEALQIVTDWCEHLRTRLHWGEDDPLFPKTRMGLGQTGGFQATGLMREHWSGTGPVRAIYQQAFAAAGLPYFNPHCFRDALVQLGERICNTPEQFKAWSQNIGHERVLTTLTSYGKVPAARQAELIRGMGLGQVAPAFDPALMAQLLAALQQANGSGQGFSGT